MPKLKPFTPVTILASPVTERYVKPGDKGSVDMVNKSIRVGGVWFLLNSNWKTLPCLPSLFVK